MTQPPEMRVAQQYMAHKGYPDLEPIDVHKVEGQFCWYFYFKLPEGLLELEVFWDTDKQEWFRGVTAFPAEQDPTKRDSRR